MNEEGIIAATFLRMQRNFDLKLKYKVFEGICMVWVCSAA
jgi:hypothetical protein